MNDTFPCMKKNVKAEPMSTPPQAPSVGIFWLYNGRIAFSHSVPVPQGQPYGDAVTGTKDHADYWEELRAAGALDALPEPLRSEYFSIPRGRVVYHKDSDTFSVYHGNNMSRKELTAVARAFALPKGRTVFEQDTHYCDFTDAEWERLVR